ncbi:UNVERIFIED_ORG: hypothetical protein J2W65_002466 [Pseudomonas parafulva]|nr:hypothetical protein [Pseudomonas parafulva]
MSVLCPTQSASLVQLIVEDSLVQGVSLQAEPIYLISRSCFINGFLVSRDGSEGLL